MAIICTTTAQRREGAAPTPPPSIYWTSMPVRSLGRFTIRTDRKGGPVAFLVCLGSISYKPSDRTEPVEVLAGWCEPEVICVLKRDDRKDPARLEQIAALEAESDAILESYWNAVDAWNAAGSDLDNQPVFPNTRDLTRRINELRHPNLGRFEVELNAALAARGLPQLTRGEINQLRVLETPASITCERSPWIKPGPALAALLDGMDGRTA